MCFRFDPSIRSALIGQTTTTTPLNPEETQSLVQDVTALFNQLSPQFTSTQADSPISTLSPEVFVKIFPFLKDWGASYYVSKQWNRNLKQLPILEKNAEIHTRFTSLLRDLYHLHQYVSSHPKIFTPSTQQFMRTLSHNTPEKKDIDTLEKMDAFEKTAQEALRGILSSSNEEKIKTFLEFSVPIQNENLSKFLNFIIKTTSITKQAENVDLVALFSRRILIASYPQSREEEKFIANFLKEKGVALTKRDPDLAFEIAQLCSQIVSREIPEKATALEEIGVALTEKDRPDRLLKITNRPDLGVKVVHLCAETVSEMLPEKAITFEVLGMRLDASLGCTKVTIQIAQLCAETVSEMLPQKAVTFEKLGMRLGKRDYDSPTAYAQMLSMAELCSKTVSGTLAQKAICFEKIGIEFIDKKYQPDLGFKVAQLCAETVSNMVPQKAITFQQMGIAFIEKWVDRTDLVLSIAKLHSETVSEILDEKAKTFEKIKAALAQSKKNQARMLKDPGITNYFREVRTGYITKIETCSQAIDTLAQKDKLI